MLLRRLPNIADAEDVAQEVLIRVLRSSRSIRENERFASWLAAVVRNAVADQLRLRQRHPLLATDEIRDEEAVQEDEPDSPGCAGLARVLRPFAERLAPAYRDAIVMSEFEAIPQTEIADRLGLSVSAVKSRTQRARQQLRKLLTDCCQIALDARRSVVACEPRPGARYHQCCPSGGGSTAPSQCAQTSSFPP
jgi:RNA polymerase sigma-70 factor (ECF subfamily)